MDFNKLRDDLKVVTDRYSGIMLDLIDTDTVVVEPWTRLKCQYGCPNYGKTLTCPPYSPKAEEMVNMVKSYNEAILFQISLVNVDNVNSLSKISAELEHELNHLGYYKAFGLGAGPCMLCDECNLRECVHPDLARPAMEACGIDVHKTIENNGYDLLGIDEENSSYFCYGLVLLQ